MEDRGYAMLAVMLWSTVASAFKISLRYLTPIQLLTYSSFFSMMCLLTIIFAQGKIKMLKPSINELKASLIMGFLNPFLYYIVLFTAYDMLPAQLAQPLNYTWPLMLVLFSSILLKHRFSTRNIIALLISFCGVIIISFKDSFQFHFNLGIFLAISSSIIWALFWILNVRDKRDASIKLFMNFLFGFLFLLPLATFYGFSLNLQGAAGAIYVGLFEMSLTFFIWFKALEKSKNYARTSNFIYLSPFISLIFIHFIVGERIYISTMVGLLLIVLGIIMQPRQQILY
ncbi:MAG: DMT family transporter [Thermoplasmata archaeon]|nr:MAG: DMT family transporter [Thermoplasmata archaeon]